MANVCAVSSRAPRRLSRIAPFAALLATAGVLGGCTLPTFGAFRGATTQGQAEFKLWSWMTIAGLVVAAFVTLLILWAALASRRRKGDATIPRQFHENVPIEILYTIIPLVIVGVIFAFTVVTENKVDAISPTPYTTVRVTGFQWGWRFQYVDSSGRPIAQVETAGRPTVLAQPPTSSQYPQFELPLGKTTRIILQSADVVHTFYVPAFNFGRYALPGVTNEFDFTPVHAGLFDGKCAQYCGLYHSEMLFSVRVVPPSAFQAWLLTKPIPGAAA